MADEKTRRVNQVIDEALNEQARRLTVRDVEDRYVALVNEYQDIKDDDVVHGKADDLHQEVLRAIAAGARNPKGLAAAALKTEDIGFARWCG